MGEVRPNYVTLVSVLPAISRLGALELGKWVHLYAKKKEIEIDNVLGSALIDMYSKCGSIDTAVQVFKRISKLNTITWSAIIGGSCNAWSSRGYSKKKEIEIDNVLGSALIDMYSKCGSIDMAVQVFKRISKLNTITWSAIIGGSCNACHAGLVEEGCLFFNHMVNVVGFEPRLEHYGCTVDVLGRAGLLKEGEQFILNMPRTPDDVIWKALLGVCKMHGNIEMGDRMDRILMNMAP
ncbi:hypothetical protein CRYUN_Cryun14cG0123900 [Craigia yunnanensis]